jgi:hypothetical protein
MAKRIDHWGNIRDIPFEMVTERHADNFVIITIYGNDCGFSYGFQLKIGRLIRQKTANIKDTIFKTADAAFSGAKSEIRRLLYSPKMRKLSADFVNIWYNQPELF